MLRSGNFRAWSSEVREDCLSKSKNLEEEVCSSLRSLSWSSSAARSCRRITYCFSALLRWGVNISDWSVHFNVSNWSSCGKSQSRPCSKQCSRSSHELSHAKCLLNHAKVLCHQRFCTRASQLSLPAIDPHHYNTPSYSPWEYSVWQSSLFGFSWFNRKSELP